MRRPGLVSMVLAALTAQAVANIDLEWRPDHPVVAEGQIVEIGLYAVSDNDRPQSMSAMDVILVWDPGYLQLLGVTNNGPYDWLSSGFPNDSGLDGLNNTWADGDALYQALAQLGNPAWATPEGLLVTTMRFKALARTPARGTPLTIPESRGRYSKTRVFDGEIPGKDVHGELGSATVRVLCANGCVADLDGDCDVDQADLATLLADYGCTSGDCPGDVDGDGDTDLADLAVLLAEWHCGR